MGDLYVPVETTYNGYKFRSRTEARWAVWFDAVGLYYQYEIDGFDINGEWYLPDFFVPSLEGRVWEGGTPPIAGSWVEIKPKYPTAHEMDLLRGLKKKTTHHVYFFVGTPWIGEFKIGWMPFGSEDFVFEEYRLPIHRDDEPPDCCAAGSACGIFMQLECVYDDRIREAFIFARQARWEHGESPIVRKQKLGFDRFGRKLPTTLEELRVWQTQGK